MSNKSFQILIIGGGAGGVTVAAQLMKKNNNLNIAIVEPSENHYYQPAWSLVGGGVYEFEDTVKHEEKLIPRGVTWIKDFAENIDPEQNQVTTRAGQTLNYDYLVVCPGVQINWDTITGFKDTVGKNQVTSNYVKEVVNYTWETIDNFKGGTAIFTFPAGAIKCPGAPQKIMYMAEEAFAKKGIRDKTKIIYANATGKMFGVPAYCKPLEEIVERKGIEVKYGHNLIELKPDTKEAVFAVNGGENVTIKYDMIHVSPAMKTPDFLQGSAISNEGGWVDVDQYTCQHNKYPNVFALGDASSLPTSKTAAAIRKEAPVVVSNLLALMAKQNPADKYGGYACCPLITGYGKTIMAEFDYSKEPTPSFPLDPTKERASMWMVKKYVLPWLYWNRMLKGEPFEPDSWRFLLNK
ncbi:FAD-dependent pyridine nucleotide-disulfide oxidoreductase [Cyanobacterium stanieri PCC 7202]|uniref:FAD-dependent pyridine nucleotide-disulfide oxidoreductase n=1 Tax=Cyanobacterium stanieri (strain ATCC 29140 / PCC 7202) TaxID=292563 RepID=K9YRN8_CYASC|nr:FAD-dependent pyridine nucleotide-disulfide oxidoreductase [Cyanobacterium stanieri PCC 7202]